MLRSLFLAIGIMFILVGVESMFIDSANLHAAGELPATAFGSSTDGSSAKSWQPGEAFPFMMIAGGAIVVVYSNTLPKRFARGDG